MNERREVRVVILVTEDAVGAGLGIANGKTVEEVAREVDVFGIENVFRLDNRVGEIHILAIHYDIGVRRVLHIELEETDPRHFLYELGNLLEKWFREIVRLAEGERVPSVRVPALAAEDGENFLRNVRGKNILVARVAGGFEESPFISPRIPPREPALRAKGRWWHRHLFVERKIFRLDCELAVTTRAFFHFSYHVGLSLQLTLLLFP